MSRVVNVHWRGFEASPERVGALIDTLASENDRLWPGDRWPPMRLRPRLGVGASGGHGPIRYSVERYDPGRHVRFRFSAPRGFEGYHELSVARDDRGKTRLEHRIEMEIRGPARLSWPLVFRPLHDALVEDALTRAQRELGEPPDVRRWSPRVRALRAVLSRRPKRFGDGKR